MLCLAIDTSGPYCSAALAGSDGILAAESERIERGHAERLMPMIDGIFASTGQAYGDLGRIGTTTGPGSFTGVRIGVATARGLALALDIEARGIGVLDVITEQGWREFGTQRETIIVAALPAARGDIFLQATTVGPDSAAAEIVLPAVKMTVVDARSWIERQDGAVRLIGSGASAIGRDHLTLQSSSTSADHADIGLLAEMICRGAGNSPPRPLYLRAPDARPQTGKAVEHA